MTDRDTRAATAAVEIALGVVAGDPTGVIAPAVQPFVGRAMAEWHRHRSRALRLVEAEVGMSREDIAEHLLDTPGLLTLTHRVLWSAGMNGQDRVIRVLAGFLSTAVADPTKIDDVTTLVGALDGFSEHHVRVLELCATTPPTATPDDELTQHWAEDNVFDALTGMRAEVVMVAVRGLIAGGFLDNRRTGEVTYADGTSGGVIAPLLEVTDLGRAVFEALEHSHEPQDGTR